MGRIYSDRNKGGAGATANSSLNVPRSMSVKDMIQDMINELTEVLTDAEKHDSGNNAAGTRVRKIMQSCKGMAQDVRIRIQGDKGSR